MQNEIDSFVNEENFDLLDKEVTKKVITTVLQRCFLKQEILLVQVVNFCFRLKS